ncbi:hypothetical protein K1T71_001708 [Dendrolimus kikuchii]|uniref:Uncharacterized protein n=1 Tax=Dendrolimus kikuchii TaxID=765133 RepID=A0ACC1DEG8_9NEOP|nr:hypothetical protein K1T71_001708 [Dendrolimus kikuchii]
MSDATGNMVCMGVMQGCVWTLGRACVQATACGARRAKRVEVAWARVRVARVEAQLAGGCGPGGIDAGGGRRRSAVAGRLRRTPRPPRPAHPSATRTRLKLRSESSRAPPRRRRRHRHRCFNSVLIPY